MQVFDNINNIVGDDFKVAIEKGSKISIVASCFSIYAYQELKKQLDSIDECRFIFTSPTFVTEKTETIPDLTNLSVKDATAILKALKLKVEIEGEGYVKNTIPEKGNPLTPNSNIKIVAGKKY